MPRPKPEQPLILTTYRIPSDLYDLIQEAAKADDRSMAYEITRRLRRSFEGASK
jgi:hypothetical protein